MLVPHTKYIGRCFLMLNPQFLFFYFCHSIVTGPSELLIANWFVALRLVPPPRFAISSCSGVGGFVFLGRYNRYFGGKMMMLNGQIMGILSLCLIFLY